MTRWSNKAPNAVRQTLGKVIGYTLRLTGSEWRFSKDYRRAVTPWHNLVYRYIDTVQANLTAGL